MRLLSWNVNGTVIDVIGFINNYKYFRLLIIKDFFKDTPLEVLTDFRARLQYFIFHQRYLYEVWVYLLDKITHFR